MAILLSIRVEVYVSSAPSPALPLSTREQELLFKGSEECDENTTFDSLLQRIITEDTTGNLRNLKVSQTNVFLQENEAKDEWLKVKVPALFNKYIYSLQRLLSFFRFSYPSKWWPTSGIWVLWTRVSLCDTI